MRTRTGFLVS
ncbi:hypothetical protein YPPY60_4838, partial [Yersinia pestis PY-60]